VGEPLFWELIHNLINHPLDTEELLLEDLGLRVAVTDDSHPETHRSSPGVVQLHSSPARPQECPQTACAIYQEGSLPSENSGPVALDLHYSKFSFLLFGFQMFRVAAGSKSGCFEIEASLLRGPAKVGCRQSPRQECLQTWPS
jgi:hypothetical protein